MTSSSRFRLLAGLIAAIAALSQAAAGDSRTVLGEWVGTYTCGQGLTGLTLTIAEATPASATAVFHFYADPSNPKVPEGCFRMSGSYDPGGGQLKFKGGDWLLRPSGYRVVSFEGSVDAEGRRFEGLVKGPPGCTTFDLARQPSPREPARACMAGALPQDDPDRSSAGAIAEALTAAGRMDLNILFDFGAATLRPDGAAQVDELGRILMAPTLVSRRVAIHGHTDAVGSEAANRDLSLRRAETVRDYLSARFNADAARFDVHGFGEDRLKYLEKPEDEGNRRVEIVLLERQ
jgi:outer membrane protein OmpA-like peptidoglycan-associated protein